MSKLVWSLVVVSLCLSLLAVVLSILALTSPDNQVMDSGMSSGQIDEVDNLDSPVLKSSLKGGNFTFSIPNKTVAIQTDAGGKSAITVYKDEASIHELEGVIYSIVISASADYLTSEPRLFEEWLTNTETTLTGHSVTIGGLEFYEGHRGDVNSLAYYHYVAESEDQVAYVIGLPSVRTQDTVGLVIQDSLNFVPTQEELNNAKSI